MVSVDYRLGPENPYPAAVEDAVEALQWILEQPKDKLHGDLSRIAVGGPSRYVSFASQSYVMRFYDFEVEVTWPP